MGCTAKVAKVGPGLWNAKSVCSIFPARRYRLISGGTIVCVGRAGKDSQGAMISFS